jgi:hypothetical protein
MRKRQPFEVKVGAFWSAGAPRRRPRRHAGEGAASPAQHRQSAAARARVAEFMAGRPPLVTDPQEAAGWSRAPKAVDASPEPSQQDVAALRRELKVDRRLR